MKKNKAAAKQLLLSSEKVRTLSNTDLASVAAGAGCTFDTYCTNDSCRMQSLSR